MANRRRPQPPEDMETFLRRAFDENFLRLRAENGHGLSPEVKEAAWQQVLLYWRRLQDVARRITDTEVKLDLPGNKTLKKREFCIEGIVDIVREDEQTIMYDLKTHDPDYVRQNVDEYRQQLNVYAHVWQNLRGQALDQTAVITTQFPDTVKQAWASREVDPEGLQRALADWDPVIEVPFDAAHVQATIDDFAKTVDAIEDGKFVPPRSSKLAKREAKDRTFATRVCRNCDARFSCSSYREHVQSDKRAGSRAFRELYDDYGPDAEREERLDVALAVTPPAKEMITNR
jgi:hypothetical protein